MKIDVYRITVVSRYEYSDTRSIDTSQFPECQDMTLPERLKWCVENADKVWGGDFEDFVRGNEHSHEREHEEGLFVYAGPSGQDEFEDVYQDRGSVLLKTGSEPGQVSGKYPQNVL